MSLPQEVLSLVFNYLEEKDLWHCQLTSKQWYEASLRPLYTNLLVDTIEKFFTYVRTITHSPQLGEYLSTIDFKFLFYWNRYSEKFSKIGLLDKVIEYCPNITKMDGHVDDDRFWSRLMDAANQGRLSRLGTLPRPKDPSLKSYINAALNFKNVLTSLYVYCDKLYSQPQLADSDTNGSIYDYIDQFKNLNALWITSNNTEFLSYFDELIDRYHNLKRLAFDTFNNISLDEIQQPNEPGPIVIPRPNIQTFECFWDMISDQSQREYLMRKFPNLQRLNVWSLSFAPLHWSQDLREFIQFALSVPDFELEIEVDRERIMDIWAEFTKMKNGCKNVTLSYLGRDDLMYQLTLSSKLGLGVEFVLYEYDYDPIRSLPHIDFLSEVGISLQSIIIDGASLFQSRHGKSSTIAWLFDILPLCPSLEELTIRYPTSSSRIHHTLQYPSLKKLTIDGFGDMKSIDFLPCLSLSLPNLCQLSLILNDMNMDPVIIDMPHTSFDLLLSSGGSAFRGSEVYIKLKTDKGLEYYLGERSMLAPISESRYLLSPESARFDINCKHLKELRIKRDLPEHGYSFIF